MIAMGISGCICSPLDNPSPDAVLRPMPTAWRVLQADIRHNGARYAKDADAETTETIVQIIHLPWDEMIACAACVSGDRSTEALRSFRVDVEKTR